MVKKTLLSARNISKSYPQGRGELLILKNLNFELHEGDAIGIVGASGSGKSTLLQILGTLDRPQQGEIFYQDIEFLKRIPGGCLVER